MNNIVIFRLLHASSLLGERMDNLRIGSLLPGARPIGHGINGALRAFALVDEEEVSIIAKYLPEREILCEVLCAQLGRGIDLPIPEPLLLIDENKTILFGSIDAGYPNLFHFVDDNAKCHEIMSKLRKWFFLESASFFDELIVNADRHKGNLLFDGNEFVLIDHGLTLHEHVDYTFSPEKWANQLADVLLEGADDDKKNKICNSATMWVSSLQDNGIIEELSDNIPNIAGIKDTLIQFLIMRNNVLLSMINHRVGNKQVDFVNG